MIERRFELDCESNIEWLMQDKLLLPIKDKESDSNLSLRQGYDLLNELNYENKHLKKSIKRQQSSNNEIIREQQKENRRLIKILDKVANYIQKQNKDMPLDDFVEWWNKMVTEGLDD